MFFENCNLGMKLFTVSNLKWGKSSHKVLPRNHNALVYRIKGNADFCFDNGMSISTKAGEIFYCPANTGYDVEYDEGEVIAVHFNIDEYFDRPEVIIPAFERKIYDLFYAMLQTWNDHKSGYYYRTLAYFLEIISLCCVDKKIKPSSKNEYVSATELLLDSALSDFCDISSICKKFNISESGFRNYFREIYGVSPIKYITEIRIREAEKLLISTNDTIDNIAYKCGYNDAKYFSRVFSKYRGCPPSEFRKY